jgi:hypothetical protein
VVTFDADTVACARNSFRIGPVELVLALRDPLVHQDLTDVRGRSRSSASRSPAACVMTSSASHTHNQSSPGRGDQMAQREHGVRFSTSFPIHGH